MIGNAITKVMNLNETEALALAYYLHQLTVDVPELSCHEEIQWLYNALVDRLELQRHEEDILNAIIRKMVKTKDLIPITPGEKYRNPFEHRGRLEKNYREDDSIYENCGNWETHSLKDINLVRILFSGTDYDFSKIVALTFFAKPGSFADATTTLPSRIPVPEKIKKAVNDVSPVKFAVDTLKLSEDEAKILLCAYRLQSCKEAYAVCNELFRHEDVSRLEMYSKCSSKSQKEIRMALKDDQKLKAFGLIDSDGDMDEDAMDAIYEKDMRLYFTDIVKNERNAKAYELDSFSVSQEETDVAVQLLKSNNPCNILLLGAPGAGKTEYARALIKKAGLKMQSYKNELEVSGKKENDVEVKALSRLNCYLSLKKDDSVLVVDEAENVLKTKEFSFFGMKLSSPQKGTVNKMLSETSENKVIWIVNYTTEMDESTLRRFTYSIKFQTMPKETLRSIAAGKLKAVNMPASLKNEILDMFGTYKVTGASVDNVVKAINSLDYHKGGEDKVLRDIKSVLEANSSLLYGKKKMRSTVKKSYDLSVLNTSIEAKEMVEMLTAAEDYKNSNQNPDGCDGVRCLFYGMSGTGKTELARYISEVLGKPLLLKRCSDLIDPYVGRTEKNIAAAFEEAEATDSILLFDEADSFFADRTASRNSWERTMVNEFLTQMEEFSGICICTTNLRKIMDPAMQRRFHIISEFKALDGSGIKTMLKKFYGNYKFSDGQVEKLCKYETVTPGDFGSLTGKIRFVPKDRLDSEYILKELVKIQEEKRMNGNVKIGFAS